MLAHCQEILHAIYAFFQWNWDNRSNWLLGLVSGYVSSWLASIWFYRRSGKQLADEAASLKEAAMKLRQMNITQARALETFKLAKFNWDSNGEPIGLVHDQPPDPSLLTTQISAVIQHILGQPPGPGGAVAG